MQILILREKLLKPLQKICSILHRNTNKNILNFLILEIINNSLFITGSDLEIELIVKVDLIENKNTGTTTVAARKLLSIIRELPEKAKINIFLSSNRLILNFKNIRFSLSTLPVESFPKIHNVEKNTEFFLPKELLKKMIYLTKFSMAYQDIRNYLNGMLFEINKEKIQIVATDGYRLAIYSKKIKKINFPSFSILIPRKGIIEIYNLLLDNDDYDLLKIELNLSIIKLTINNYVLISKLINNNFPNYKNILNIANNKYLEINRNMLKEAFSRIAILSNEKFKSIKLEIKKNSLKLSSNNIDKEEAEEILEIDYLYNEIEININYNYVIDILKVLKCDKIRMSFTNESSIVKIEDCENNDIQYIVMPMKI